MNQGKLEVVQQEMARVNINILGISELKWTGMGEFNSDERQLYGGANGDLLQEHPCCTSQDCCFQCPCTAVLSQASAGAPQTLTGRSGSVFCGLQCSFPCVLVHTRFFFVPSKSLWCVWGLI